MNIVTIDFDIIMAPSIEMYNNMITTVDNPIDTMIENFPLLQHLDADFSIYQKLTNYLYKVAPKVSKEEIYFINTHEDVVRYLPIDNDVSIYNIDHHHDITYGDIDEELEMDNLGCGNWGKFLLDQDMIQDFIWIHDENSIPPSDELMEKYPFDDDNLILEDGALDNLPIPDKIIICFSSAWTPNKFAPLLWLWMDILGKMKGHNYWFDNY